ncbi:PKD domain-containing protein, partial [Methanosarcina sp.]|uniref:PKD domain-containing protein n=1 Tax=Methanosarcina sp. TaxID=2213 RepID=UPI002AB8B8A4
KTVDVGSAPRGVAVSPDGSKVYVANSGNSAISVINTATDTVTKTVDVGSAPYGVSVTPDGAKAYVANQNSNTVSVIDTATNKVIDTVIVGSNPIALGHFIGIPPAQTLLPVANFTTDLTSGYAPLSVQFTDTSKNATSWKWNFGDGESSTEQNPTHNYRTVGNYTVTLTVTNEYGQNTKKSTINVQSASPMVPYAYITNYGSNTVSVIDTASNTVTATVNVGYGPLGVAVNSDGTKIYVANRGSTTVSIIDTATNNVTATLSIANYPTGIATNPTKAKVYLTTYYGIVYVIDTITNTVTATLNVGYEPNGIVVSPDGSKAYVTSSNDGTVSVFDTDSSTVTKTMKVGSNPYGIAVTPDGTKVYVANSNSNNVSVIDTETDNVTKTVDVGSAPRGVAVSPDGTKVYVANSGNSAVSVIDTATDTVTKTVDVGSSPYGIAVTPDGAKVYVANQNSNNVSVIDSATNNVIDTVIVGSNPIALGQFIGIPPASQPVIDGRSDLTVDNINWSPTRINEGETVIFNASIRNIGDGSTLSSFYVRFLADDQYIGQTQIDQLNANESTIVTQQWTATANAKNITVIVDYYDNIRELDETNNRLTVSLSEVEQADLVVSNLTWTPETFHDGTLVTFEAEIRNVGIGNASKPFDVGFYVNESKIGTVTVNSTLFAGESKVVSTTWNAVPGTYVLNVKVDDTNTIFESNESNNLGSALLPSIYQPELLISNITVPSSIDDGSTVIFNVTVENAGLNSTENWFGVRFYVDENDLGYAVIEGLSAGENKTVSKSWTATPGNQELTVKVDADGWYDYPYNAYGPRVNESNETNNNITLALPTVEQSDLIVSDLTWAPENFSIGDTVTFNASINNIGNGSTLRSFNTEFIVDQNVVGTKTISGSLKGESAEISHVWSATSGDHNITVKVDSDGQINESNETNNLLFKNLSFVEEKYILLLSSDSQSYAKNSTAVFNAKASSLGSPDIYLKDSDVSLTLTILDENNNTLYTSPMSYTTTGFIANVDLTDYSKGNYNATVTLRDINGLTAEKTIPFKITENFSVSISTDKSIYDREETVHVTGRAQYGDGSPVINTPALLDIKLKGYTQTYSLATDSSGNISYYFKPGRSEAGNFTAKLSVNSNKLWISAETSFEIYGLYMSPSGTINYETSKNSSENLTFSLRNYGETDLHGVTVRLEGDPVAGVETQVVQLPSETLAAGAQGSFKVKISSSNVEVSQANYIVAVTTDEGSYEEAKLFVHLVDASPAAVVSPTSIIVGMNPNNTLVKTVSISNAGYESMNDINISKPSLDWVSVSLTNLGSISPGTSKSFNIFLHPNNETAVGVYQETITISSSNHEPVNIYLTISVTSSEQGDLMFHVVNNLGQNISGASVVIQNPKVLTQVFQGTTDENGYYLFKDVSAGTYNYFIKASGHESKSGSVTVSPEIQTLEEPVLYKDILGVKLTVTPIQIGDDYDIQLNLTFETEVPPPLLIPKPLYINYGVNFSDPVYENDSSIMISNPGLLSVFNVTVDSSSLQGVDITFPTGNTFFVDELKAQSTISIPYHLKATDVSNESDSYRNSIKMRGDYLIFGENSDTTQKVYLSSEIPVFVYMYKSRDIHQIDLPEYFNLTYLLPRGDYSPDPLTPKPVPLPTLVETVHERVKFSISQDAILERDAFAASLEMTNKLTDQNIENINVNLEIKDKDGNDASNLFYVNLTSLNSINSIDGIGIISPLAIANADWLLVPEINTGGTTPAGKDYTVQAFINYTVGDVLFSINSTEERITVMPQPLLNLTYTIPGEVKADTPFNLTLNVTNVGYGTAKNLKLDSAQPVIYENKAGLLVSFELIGSGLVNGPGSNSMLIDFGDLAPGDSKEAYWTMKSSLDGTFTEFKGSFSHSNAFGGDETSLINDIKYIGGIPYEVNPTDEFLFVQLTDVHIKWPEATSFSTKFSDSIQYINSMNPKPKFIIITGDCAEYDEIKSFNIFSDILKSSNIPVYVVPGNHDQRKRFLFNTNLEHFSKTISGARDFVGQEHGHITFNEGEFLFIGLDSGKDYNADVSSPESNGLDELQMKYLNSLVVNQSYAEIPKIIFMHHPVIDNKDDDYFLGRTPLIDNAAGGNNGCIAFNRQEFINYCIDHNVQLVLTGHSHADKEFSSSGDPIDSISDRPMFVQTDSVTNGSFRQIEINGDKTTIYKSVHVPQHDKDILYVYSPVDLHVYDLEGRHAGINEYGGIDRNIPSSFYLSEYEDENTSTPETIILYNTNDEYRAEIVSNFSKQKIEKPIDTFNFTIEMFKNDKIISVNFYNVSIQENTIASIVVNPTTTDYALNIDIDGDGIIDQTRYPDSDKVNHAPTAVINSPANNSIWNQGDLIVFKGSGLDPEEGILTDSFTWYSDLDGSIGHSNEFNSTDLSAGMHNITLMVSDSTDLTATENVTITILDNKSPTLRVDYPVDGKFFAQENVTINGIAYDDSGIESVTVNGIDAGEEEWSKRIFLNEGVNKVEIVATDNAGFSTTKSLTLHYEPSLVNDHTPPASVTNLQNTTGTNPAGQSWINWTWTTPEDSDFSHSMIFLDGFWFGNVSTPYFNITGLYPDSTHTISVRTVDIAENMNGTLVNSSVRTQQWDTIAPVVNMVALYTTTPRTGDSLLVTVNATDNLAVSSVEANDIMLLYQEENIWSGVITALEGSHFVNVSVVDVAGNNAWNNESSYTTVAVDSLSPSSIIGLKPSTGITWVNFTWVNPTDPDFNHTEIYLNDTFQTNTSAEYFNATGLNPKTNYTISTRTVDLNGNVNETWVNASAKTGSSPDSTSPVIESVILLPTSTTTGSTINVTVNVTDNVGVSVVKANGVPLLSQGESLWNGSITALEGTHSVNVSAVDEAGNVAWDNSTSYTALTPDILPPSSITDLQSTTGNTWVNWTWQNPTDPDFNHTEIYLNDIFQTNTSAEHFNATGLEPETSYTIGTRTVDINGNVNETWVNSIATTKKAPILVKAGSDQTMEEGATVNFEGSFTASGSHTYSYHWDFGDGSVEDSSLTTSHTYADDGAYTVNLTVTDEGGDYGNDTLKVTVNNAAPTVTSIGSEIFENDTATVSGTISDPGPTDTFEVAINWGDGNTETFLYPSGSTTFSETHQYMDDNPGGTSSDDYIVNITVTDDDMGEGTASTTVTVNNLVPEVGEISSPIDPVQIGIEVKVDSTFKDSGTFDTHTAVWDWGDGFISDGFITENNGAGTVNVTHAYSSAGIYKVNLTVTDDDLGSNYSVSNYIIIYDPEGGFVTGGGWINSPEGAYAPDPTLTGTANFGFVSKYKKGATVPTGVTQFNFRVADLNFHSDTYEWLVIAGARAQYKGTGTINGEGEYGFMLTAIDGELNSGGGSDRFRIKIWDKASETIVYDNMLDADDDADLTTVIQGGSITIHKGK